MTTSLMAPWRSATGQTLMLLAGGGSLALLVGAWFFQYAVGMAPCAMCYWQRWPHMAAVAILALILLLRSKLFAGFAVALAAAGALAAGTSGALGLYHTGVERGWWLGPSSCTSRGQDLGGLSGTDLLSVTEAQPIVLCDRFEPFFLGLTMANWNMLLSFGLTALWIVAALRQHAERKV